MARNVKLVRVEEGEAQVTALEGEEAQMRRLYLQDGVIDAEEQDALDRVAGKIIRLRQVIADLRAEIERNRDIWFGRASDLAAVQGKLAELQAFDHPDTAAIRGEVDLIPLAVTDERWADATAALDQVMVSLEPVYADYLLQSAAEARYLQARDLYDTRCDVLRFAEPQVEEIVSGLAQVESRNSTIEAAVTARNLVEAEELLADAVLLLVPLEQRLDEIQRDMAAYQTGLEAIQSRLNDLSSCEFATLAEAQSEVLAVQTDMESSATAQDFAAALTHLQSLTGLVESLHAQYLTLITQRDAFEARYRPLAARAAVLNTSEVARTADAMQQMIELQDAIVAAEAEEAFETALANLPPFETAIQTIEDILSDRDLYEARLAAMQDELLEASQSRPEWNYLLPIQTALATIQTDMETAAGAENYEVALTKIGELEAKLVAFFTEIAKRKEVYSTKRARFDRQVRAAENDASPALSAEIAAVRAAIPPIDTLANAEDWVGAAAEIDNGINAIAAFNAAMLRQDAPGMTTGMTPDALELAGRSPELTQSLEDLEEAGWQVVIGTRGKGSFCSRGSSRITIDPDDMANAQSLVQTLAHEVGHAEDEPEEPDMSSRQSYLDGRLAGEGAATLENIRVQRELLANGGADIGIAGNPGNHAEYNRIFDQYEIDGDAEAAEAAIARVFGAGEVPSVPREDGSSYTDYNEYYGEYYDSLWWFQKL